jgi:hypothetical protein
MKSRIDRDILNMASAKRVANATLGTLNSLQNWSKEEQVLAAAAVFVTLADFLRVPAQDVFSAVNNMMVDKEGKARPEFSAIMPYMEGELR